MFGAKKPHDPIVAGHPLSEWKRHTFKPRHDITAYELALIVKTYMDASERGSDFMVHPEEMEVAPIWDGVSRHFEPVEESGSDERN